MHDYRLKHWETALLLALCITFGFGLWAETAHRALAGELVRLHVVANSDDPSDQAEKLQMRDRVLALLSPRLEDCRDPAEAVNIIYRSLPELEALGDVSVKLDREYYPTRHYASFSLPAGEYTSLRVKLGQGRGQNWWCVVFPPLCDEALAETDPAADAFLSLDKEDAALLTRDGTEYELRFRVLEWWGQLRELLA